MITPEDLYEEWTNGEQNGMRTRRVQEVRDDLSAAIGMQVPQRRHEIENWLETMRTSGTITRKLRRASEATDDETDNNDSE